MMKSESWYEFYLSKTTKKWVDEKRKIDDIGELWRIHDNLYDVSDFIEKHPGGKFWLEETQGMDITEAFESHHIKSDTPQLTLQKYFVKKATKPRASPFTFYENGFYKTIKRKARPILKTLPKDCHKKSNMYTDLLLLATFLCSWLANVFSSYYLIILASITCSFLLVAVHNYNHQRDNFRMLYGDLMMMSSREYRFIHILSHHAFSNSRGDLQLNFVYPVVNFFPESKSFFTKYFTWITCTVIFFPIKLHLVGLINLLGVIINKKNYVNSLLPLLLPVAMYFGSGKSLWSTLGTWQLILVGTSILVTTIAYTTTHAHPDLYIEGDAMRPKEELDWGVGQLDTTFDRKDIMGNQFLSFVMFGDHALHHLFPTLDHAYLQYLYPLLEETLKEFNFKSINITTTPDIYLGFYRQAARELPKTIPPSLGKIF
ncbi:hypothetical protein FQR65_LT06433 [Abscondita terminalis]|nr:hypothetical protein FQR65_LT06433 [Abscondita terminalis]